MNKEAIGIIGGMGPFAGNDLSGKIISQTRASLDQEHLPQVLFSFPGEINDRTAFILGKVKENPGNNIANIILQMEKAGVTVAGLACNSAHAPQIFDVITDILKQQGSKIKLLHMIKQVALFIRYYYPEVKKVGVLGTTGTQVTGLYEMLEDYDLENVNLTESEQELLHSAIYDKEYGIKSGGSEVSEHAITLLLGACRSLKTRGAGLLVFGCTEFPFAYKEPYAEGLPVIDSNMVLARALIHEFAPEKLKPLKRT